MSSTLSWQRIYIFDVNNNLVGVTHESKDITELFPRVVKTMKDFNLSTTVAEVKSAFMNKSLLLGMFQIRNKNIHTIRRTKTCNVCTLKSNIK